MSKNKDAYPAITRVWHQGSDTVLDLSYNAYDALCDACRAGHAWHEAQTYDGCNVLFDLTTIEVVVQMSSEARMRLREQQELLKLTDPD